MDSAPFRAARLLARLHRRSLAVELQERWRRLEAAGTGVIMVAGGLLLAAIVSTGQLLCAWFIDAEPTGLWLSLLLAMGVGLALRGSARGVVFPLVAGQPLRRWVGRLAGVLSLGRLVTLPLLVLLLLFVGAGQAFAGEGGPAAGLADGLPGMAARALLWGLTFAAVLTVFALGRRLLVCGPGMLAVAGGAGLQGGPVAALFAGLACSGGLWLSDPSPAVMERRMRGMTIRSPWFRLQYQAHLRDHGVATLTRLVLAVLTAGGLWMPLHKGGWPPDALLALCSCLAAWVLAGMTHASCDWRQRRSALFDAQPVGPGRWFLVDCWAPLLFWLLIVLPLAGVAAFAGLTWWRLLLLLVSGALFLLLQVQLVRRFPVEAGVLGFALIPFVVLLLAWM